MHPLFSSIRLLAVLAGLFLLALGGLARADAELSATDERAIRETIQAQLEAFQADDAERAFSLAAPRIQWRFATPEAFMTMVRTHYPVVYRPARFGFKGIRTEDAVVVQLVEMWDDEQQLWYAAYQMLRAEDGSWRIGGCALTRPPTSKSV